MSLNLVLKSMSNSRCPHKRLSTCVYISLQALFSLATLCIASDSHCYNPRLRANDALHSLKFVPLVTWRAYARYCNKSEVLIAQIYSPPATHESLWTQKVWFRHCDRQYEYHLPIPIAKS